jgi:hypothetical protein
VTVRYVLSSGASVSLWVRQGSGRALLAARATGVAGLQTINWNRRLGRQSAPHGHYTLTVTVTSGRSTTSSSITVGI